MKWWEQAVGYQVYLRSYADSDDDGIGDFPGLTSKLEYIASIGVDAVWITPFYPSPQADFGYDVADYTNVDPAYGTLADFDRFVDRAHQLGLKVILDIVPNHTSSQHPMFRAAIEGGPGSEFWDYYVWKEPEPLGGPPNNWFSIFGGPAWTLMPQHNRYYMHLFLPEQPDLNWANPAVHDEFKRILGFWVERGADGFRIDVAHSLVEHPSYADNPVNPALEPGVEPKEFGDLIHVYDVDQPSVTEIFDEWREVVGPDIFLIGEVYVTEPGKVRRYVEGSGLSQSFYFALNSLEWDPVDFAARVKAAVEEIPSGWGWVQGSHDEHRGVTRFGGGPEGIQRSLALWVAMMGLPGTPFLYQGDELALQNGAVGPADIQDPVGLWKPDEGRDPCRTPMPWTRDANHGFSSVDPWLRAEPRPAYETVEYQEKAATSPLRQMRRLISARRDTAAGRTGAVRWMDAPEAMVAYRRDSVTHVANLADSTTSLDIGSQWSEVYSLNGATANGGTLGLPARSGMILRRTD